MTTQELATHAALAAAFLRSVSKEGQAEINERLTVAVDSQDEVRKGPMLVMSAIQRAYGMDKMDEFPIVDSDSGNRADKYKIPGTNKDGKTTTKTGSWCNDYVDATAVGIEIKSRLDAISVAKATPGTGEQPYDTMNPTQLDEEAQYWRGRLSSARACFKNALRLHQKIEAVKGMNPDQIEVAYSLDSNGALKATTYPIVVQHPKERTKWHNYSVSQFLLLDTAKAEKVGPFDANKRPTFEALTGTIGRKQKDDKAKETAAAMAKPFTLNELEVTFARIGHTLNNATDDGRKMYAQVLKRLNENDPAFLLTVGDTALVFDAIYKDIESAYQAASVARQKAIKAGRVA